MPHGVFLLSIAGSKCVLAGTMALSSAICAGDSNFKAGYKIRLALDNYITTAVYICSHLTFLY